MHKPNKDMQHTIILDQQSKFSEASRQYRSNLNNPPKKNPDKRTKTMYNSKFACKNEQVIHMLPIKVLKTFQVIDK
jgi:hypothetical protein